MRACHHCGSEIRLSGPVGRTEGCPNCHSDLKCCLNCALHDPGASQACREPQVELVGEKAKANFCEFFAFRSMSPLGIAGPNERASSREEALRALDSLFRKD